MDLNNSDLVDELYELIAGNQQLKEIDLSHSIVQLKHLYTILSAFNQNDKIEVVNLRGITSLQITPKELETHQSLVDAGVD